MSITIQFISDYVCPVCYINKIALQKACFGKDVQIEYLPYELTPESQKQVDVYHDPIRKANWQRTLAPVAIKENIDMKLPPKISPRPYTRLAHEGYLYALDHGKDAVYNDRIYQAYFSDEYDIGNITVLKQLAKEIGLDADEFEKALETGTYHGKLVDIKTALNSTHTISTLPTIKIGDTILSGGIHSNGYFEGILAKINTISSEEVIMGPGCNINGCTF